jgi:hypothetical protein
VAKGQVPVEGKPIYVRHVLPRGGGDLEKRPVYREVLACGDGAELREIGGRDRALSRRCRAHGLQPIVKLVGKREPTLASAIGDLLTAVIGG